MNQAHTNANVHIVMREDEQNRIQRGMQHVDPGEAELTWGRERRIAAQAFAEYDATACDAQHGRVLPVCENGEVIPHMYRLFPVCGPYVATAYVGA